MTRENANKTTLISKMAVLCYSFGCKNKVLIPHSLSEMV